MSEKKKVGRPKKWTKKAIEELADELVPFYKNNPEKRFVANFCEEFSIGKQRISEFANENQNFSEQLAICKTICESRLADALIDANANGAKFALSCQHEWQDITRVEQKTELNATVTGSLATAFTQVDEIK